MLDNVRILRLDAAGNPRKWIDLDQFGYAANNKIIWSLGEQLVLRGGHNKRGEQSLLEVPSIVSIKGPVKPHAHVVQLTRHALAKRDRCMCAYCGNIFDEDNLTMEHVLPRAKGGRLTWSNIVAACRPCNTRKARRTPEEAKMPLLYVPYVPDAFESLLLERRNILVDQMEFLMDGLARHNRNSRLLIAA